VSAPDANMTGEIVPLFSRTAQCTCSMSTTLDLLKYKRMLFPGSPADKLPAVCASGHKNGIFS
jgi:hypothetical protein